MLDEVRIDKWLWAARFYKTRSLASDAVAGGKVHINGARTKPSKKINIDDEIQISIGPMERTIIVRVLSEKRVAAKIAQTFYEETSESVQKREAYQELLKNAPSIKPLAGKPTKKDRREINKIKGY